MAPPQPPWWRSIHDHWFLLPGWTVKRFALKCNAQRHQRNSCMGLAFYQLENFSWSVSAGKGAAACFFAVEEPRQKLAGPCILGREHQYLFQNFNVLCPASSLSISFCFFSPDKSKAERRDVGGTNRYNAQGKLFHPWLDVVCDSCWNGETDLLFRFALQMYLVCCVIEFPVWN